MFFGLHTFMLLKYESFSLIRLTTFMESINSFETISDSLLTLFVPSNLSGMNVFMSFIVNLLEIYQVLKHWYLYKWL